MTQDIEAHRQNDELWRLKMLHMEANSSSIESAMKKQETKAGANFERNLLGWDAPRTWFDHEELRI
jgi:hypothetical protein